MAKSTQEERRKKFKTNDLSKPMKSVESKLYGLSEPIMETLCSYVIADNTNIHRAAIKKLKEVIDCLDETNFKTQTLLLKYTFLKIALDIRIKNNGASRSTMLSLIDNVIDIKPIEPFLSNISDESISSIENCIQQICNNVTMDNYAIKIRDTFENYTNSDFRSKNQMFKPIMNLVGSFHNDMRKNIFDTDDASTLFRLSNIQDSLYDVHKFITAPSYKLRTGMVGLNNMLGGGFEKGRVYCFFGLPGEGKTVTLENLLYQIWKYNADYKTMDPTKKPCIVLLTMENFVIEYICALYHIITRGKELRECASADEALAEFARCQFEYGKGNPIEIVIKFKPVMSVNTDYLYQLTDELKDEGFEPICLIQDYLMRIRPSVWTKDQYQDLGTVVNDFKTFGTLENIPVITASQLNRGAVKVTDESREKLKHNLIKNVTRADFGDSINIDRNLDGSFIIIPELWTDARGLIHKFMGMKLVKHRYPIDEKKTDTSIYIPYYDSSQIAFMEDYGLASPLYKTSLETTEEDILGQFSNFAQMQTVPNMNDLSQNTVMPTPPQEGLGLNIPIQPTPQQEEIDIKFSQIVENNKKELEGVVVCEHVPQKFRNITEDEYKAYIDSVISHMMQGFNNE